MLYRVTTGWWDEYLQNDGLYLLYDLIKSHLSRFEEVRSTETLCEDTVLISSGEPEWFEVLLIVHGKAEPMLKTWSDERIELRGKDIGHFNKLTGILYRLLGIYAVRGTLSNWLSLIRRNESRMIAEKEIYPGLVLDKKLNFLTCPAIFCLRGSFADCCTALKGALAHYLEAPPGQVLVALNLKSVQDPDCEFSEIQAISLDKTKLSDPNSMDQIYSRWRRVTAYFRPCVILPFSLPYTIEIRVDTTTDLALSISNFTRLCPSLDS